MTDTLVTLIITMFSSFFPPNCFSCHIHQQAYQYLAVYQAGLISLNPCYIFIFYFALGLFVDLLS
ncbi:Putative uncharacterized protein [Moritella viscosa]|nr:Putative uncharacterized protein [Moritella viscosa]